jgi:hypothetical protein
MFLTRMKKGAVPLEIRIDKEGTWYYQDAEMTRRDIVYHFYRWLKKDGQGSYWLEQGNECYAVAVEDVPYIVRAATLERSPDGEEHVRLTLSDGTDEEMDLTKPLRIGRENVPYCRIKAGEYEARFSRSAYYQICQWIDYDADQESYCIRLNRRAYPLQVTK